MHVLLLSCSTGEGHNHCARAVRQSLEAMGHETDFFDMLHLFGEPGPISVEGLLNVISTKAPNLFGLMYKAGERVSALGVTSPVYLVNTTYGDELCNLINQIDYDAVVCSHLFPMETLTYIRRNYDLRAKCYGILSDYTCIPFLAETELDAYFLPHEMVRAECVRAGIPAEKLIVTGMPVAAAFRETMTKAEAREALNIPAEKKLYLVMTGGIGCGDAIGLCERLLVLPDEDALSFASAITDAKRSVHTCKVCQNLTEGELCSICASDRRDHSIICVVSEPRDVLSIERGREFNGTYHVLHGVLSPMSHVGPEDIRIKELLHRVAEEDVEEVIMATNPDTEGEATAMYISRLLKPFQIKVTRLAYGIPVGSNLEFADDATLNRALEGRTEM